jgi:hypothetical protein
MDMRIRFQAAARVSANLAPNFRALRPLLRMLPVAAVSMAGLVIAGGYALYAVMRARGRSSEDRAHGREQGEVLDRLTYLHDAGNLSDDEYTRQRERILAAS